MDKELKEAIKTIQKYCEKNKDSCKTCNLSVPDECPEKQCKLANLSNQWDCTGIDVSNGVIKENRPHTRHESDKVCTIVLSIKMILEKK